MVNIFKLLDPLVNVVMKLAGLTPKLVEIEPGTLVNIWVPSHTLKNTTKTANNKPVVVFIHGFAVNGILTWLFQAMFLSGTYDIYVPDLMFFGGSTTDKPDRTPEFQADCLAKGLSKLGVKKCTIVGLSYGGMIGMKMAKNYPDLVESMVATATVMELTESITAVSQARIGVSTWSELLMPETVDGVIKTLTVGTHKLPWLPRVFYKHFLQAMFDNRKEKNELLEALVISDKDAIVPNYTQNIQLLWGDDDKIFNSEAAQNLKEQLGKRTRIVYIEKSGHLVELERPFVYNRRLKNIISSFRTELKQKLL